MITIFFLKVAGLNESQIRPVIRNNTLRRANDQKEDITNYCTKTIAVEPGYNLISITKKYNTTTLELSMLNPTISLTKLSPGMPLKVKVQCEPSQNNTRYEVLHIEDDYFKDFQPLRQGSFILGLCWLGKQRDHMEIVRSTIDLIRYDYIDEKGNLKDAVSAGKLIMGEQMCGDDYTNATIAGYTREWGIHYIVENEVTSIYNPSKSITIEWYENPIAKYPYKVCL